MTFGKYELFERIGTGTIGEVFKAKSFGAEGFEKRLVVKKINPELSSSDAFTDLFVEDIQTALLLNHANIVQVFDLGRVTDTYYIAMELIRGRTLFDLLSSCRRHKKSIGLPLAAHIASEVAKGLDFAHRKRGRDLKPLSVVHGDISAHNILISNEGEVKISDFGLARAKEAVARHITLKRHPLYLSPEQARNDVVDKRSDIFCLGILLYELISLTHPLKGVGRPSISSRVETRAFPPIAEIYKEGEMPTALTGVLDKCLAFDPDERFADAGAIYETLISYVYETKSRVGAHTVADFLTEVPEIEKRDSEFRAPQENKLKAVFRTSMPPESPNTIRHSSSAPPDAPGLSESDPPLETPEAPLGDVTLLVLNCKSASLSDFKVESFSEIVENNGGALVSTDSNIAVAVFGLDLTYGKETEEALAAAFKLRRSAVVHNPIKGEQVVVSVWPSKIPLTGDDTYLTHDLYLKALARAKTAAALATEGVVTSKKGRRLSSSAYHFDRLEVEWPEGEPREVYQVIGRLTFLERRGRFFGRHDQLQAIGRVFMGGASGTGTMLFIEGETGIGKTRLVREGQWRLLSSGGDVGWYESQCVGWNREVPFSALADIFRSVLALDLVTPKSEIEEKVARLRELSLTEEEIEAVSALLGLSVDNVTVFLDSGRIFYSAMLHMMTGLCRDRMTVFVWDNADDIDADSVAVIRNLTRKLAELPFVGILIFRQPLKEAWKEARRVVQRMRIDPLIENDANRFALACMGAERAPNTLLSTLYQTTHGNTLLLENLILALKDDKKIEVRDGKAVLVEGAEIPPMVLETLLERQVSGLPDDERLILEAASVVGSRFNTKVLGRMVDADFAEVKSSVMRLRKKGLLTRVSVAEYAFATKKLWDVVSDGLSESNRCALHHATAEALLSIFESRVEYLSARLAVHYELGDEPIQAIEQYSRAGKKAAEGHAHRAALHFYIRALDLLRALPETDPDSVVSVCLPVGELAIKSNAYELGLETIQVAEWVSEKVTDRANLVRVLLLTSELHAHCEHTVEVDWYMEWAMDISRELDDDELTFDVLESAGHVYYLLGDIKKAAPRFREAIERASAQTDRDRLIACMAKLARVEASAGELEQAMKTLAAAENLLEESSDLLTVCEIEQSRGRAYFMAGNTDRAISSQLKLLDIAKEYGLKEYIADTAYLAGELYLESGDHPKAFAYLNMSKETAEAIGLKNLINIDNLLLSYIDAVEIGGGSQIEELEKSLLDALARDAVWEQLHLLYYLSKIYIEKGLRKLAREHLEQLIKLGSTLHNRLYYTKAEELLKEIDALESIAP